jgi:hypothetical protein
MPEHGVCTLSGPVTEPETRAEGEHLLVRYAPEENTTAWSQWTDSLIGWGVRYAEDDDDVVWPNRALLATAYKLACRMRDEDVPAPWNVVPDGEGGIAFEWRAGRHFAKLVVATDGSLEFLAFSQGKLVLRNPLPMP